MSLITAAHLAKSFGAEDLFSEISLSMPQHARIGLVGENGIGKTTLLRMLYGIEKPDGGTIAWAKDLKMGYLPQESRFQSSQTLQQECREALADIFNLQNEIEALTLQVQQNPQDDTLINRLGDLHERYERLGGYTIDSYILRIVSGLGFEAVDLTRPITQFSGGERTRAYLAKLLLMNPTLLLLDEPTNHLDIQAMEWLEDFLKKYDGAVLIVSHDRYFLDQTVNTIWEMTPAIESYPGNYSAFLHLRQERMERQMKEYESQQEFIAKEEEYVSIYVHLQNMRYHDSIFFISDIPDELMEYQIPKLTLQPVIENSILHGILEKPSKSGTIVLTGWMEDGDIVLLISDDGVGIAPDKLPVILSGEGTSISGGTNIAIYNTHRRLQVLYGADYGLTYSSDVGKGTEVQIRIPAKKDAENK